MAKADVIALVNDLGGTRSDGNALVESATVDRYYDDVVRESGLMFETAVNAEFVAAAAGTATYTLPNAAVRMLAICYDDTELRPTLRRALDASDREWRLRRGRPTAFTMQDEDVRTVRVVPVPAVDGATIGAATPFSGTWPAGNLMMLYTERVTDVLPWDELWTALEVAAREFGRESDHFDAAVSLTFRQLSAVVRRLVGTET